MSEAPPAPIIQTGQKGKKEAPVNRLLNENSLGFTKIKGLRFSPSIPICLSRHDRKSMAFLFSIVSTVGHGIAKFAEQWTASWAPFRSPFGDDIVDVCELRFATRQAAAVVLRFALVESYGSILPDECRSLTVVYEANSSGVIEYLRLKKMAAKKAISWAALRCTKVFAVHALYLF